MSCLLEAHRGARRPAQAVESARPARHRRRSCGLEAKKIPRGARRTPHTAGFAHHCALPTEGLYADALRRPVWLAG